ncbi:MAG TPA: carbohydrate ABC transporter permease [Candidatus Eisenbergiella merdipullorum]|uniref:Carbohydrate ABC transporter permease n=1 Tax=Candidatus Eisenbergiella merdipullorum TaxID=2838553 RepID=A0A9D2I5H6_9FIRM|nr:carbohydrate ABC transporter permease [Candidatus Eisenbergiella merdipullorum]
MNIWEKRLGGSSLFQATVNVLLFLFLIIELYPITYVISCSFSDPDAVAAGKVILFPEGFTLDGYKKILEYGEIWIGYGNTIFYTVVGTLVNLAVTLPCAYALSRKELIGRKYIMTFFLITMYVGGGLIPSYLNMKSFGLVNTRIGLVILGALSVYNLIVARTFFANTIPYEITEAAKIDGCDDFSIFRKIVMPLSKAITVVMILYYGIGHWNSYFNAMIYLEDRNKFPLQMFLREILLQAKLANETENAGLVSVEEMERLSEMAKSAELIKYCVIIVATLPMMIVYPKLQKYFEKGVMIGSVKG